MPKVLNFLEACGFHYMDDVSDLVVCQGRFSFHFFETNVENVMTNGTVGGLTEIFMP